MIVMGEHEAAGDVLQARLDRLVAVFDLAFDELRRVVALHGELTHGGEVIGRRGVPTGTTGPDLPPAYPDNVAHVGHLGRGLGSLVVADGDREATDHGTGPAAHQA
jgi:hypothetical protein